MTDRPRSPSAADPSSSSSVRFAATMRPYGSSTHAGDVVRSTTAIDRRWPGAPRRLNRRLNRPPFATRALVPIAAPPRRLRLPPPAAQQQVRRPDNHHVSYVNRLGVLISSRRSHGEPATTPDRAGPGDAATASGAWWGRHKRVIPRWVSLASSIGGRLPCDAAVHIQPAGGVQDLLGVATGGPMDA